MDVVEIAQYFNRRTAEILSTIDGLVCIDTPTGNKEAATKFATHYRDLLESAGAACRLIDGEAGPHLVAHFRGSEVGREPILLVGHLDTVWPLGEVARRPPTRKDGRLYGPGTYDMRAGLALIFHALELFQSNSIELGAGITVFVSSDEEQGSPTAHPHLDELVDRTRVALVAEPPMKDGGLKAERRGVASYRIEVLGREAHAGEPQRGVNAIVALMKIAMDVASWARPERGLLVNVGEISGGTASNVVPGRATAGIDVRFDDPTDIDTFDRRLRERIAEVADSKVSVSGGPLFPPLIDCAEAKALRRRVQAIGRTLGLSIGEGKSGGGSDGSYLASKGVNVVDGLGVDGDGAHALHEHIVIDSVAPRAALLALAILDFASDGCIYVGE